MGLHIIGVGLGGASDLSLHALALLKRADAIYLDHYTSTIAGVVEGLDALGLTVTPVPRKTLEDDAEKVLIQPAKTKTICLLAIGHPLVATTHITLVTTAREKNIPVEIVHNASIVDAVAVTGLQVYKFGKVGSIPFAARTLATDTPARLLGENLSIGAHTLFLLDLRPEAKEYLSIADAIHYLEQHPMTVPLLQSVPCVIGCAQLGQEGQEIIYGSPAAVAKHPFHGAPYCLIVPGPLHFMEEEALAILGKRVQ